MKKTIGYRLKDEFYNEQIGEAALAIEGHSRIGTAVYTQHQILGITATESISKLKKAGVLDVWFEPVCEEYKVGDWITVTKILGNGWLNNTSERTFKIMAMPTPYFDGEFYTVCDKYNIKQGGLHAKFRMASKEEIEAVQPPNIEINGYKEVCEKTGAKIIYVQVLS